jgi:hypothetical protein
MLPGSGGEAVRAAGPYLATEPPVAAPLPVDALDVFAPTVAGLLVAFVATSWAPLVHAANVAALHRPTATSAQARNNETRGKPRTMIPPNPPMRAAAPARLTEY